MAPRERKPALAALAVLLILLGALGATVMVMRAGNKVAVIRIDQDVAAGDPIPQSALHQVMLSDDSGVNFIKWSQRNSLMRSFRAKTNIVSGSVLVRSMIVDKSEVINPGKSLVGLSLKDGQFPRGLEVGDVVAAYRVGNDAAKSLTQSNTSALGPDNLISGHLIIKDAPTTAGGLSSGDTTVTVLADSEDAGKLTIAASANEVALVRVTNSKN